MYHKNVALNATPANIISMNLEKRSALIFLGMMIATAVAYQLSHRQTSSGPTAAHGELALLVIDTCHPNGPDSAVAGCKPIAMPFPSAKACADFKATMALEKTATADCTAIP